MKLTNVKNIVLLFVCLAGTGAIGQEPPPPGSMKLLPGYHHRPKQGIDSTTGTISKDGGLDIQYDIGEMAGNYSECAWCGWIKGEVWRKKQVINGQEIVCVLTKKKMFVVSFPKSHANFYARVRTQGEMADMLLMLITFEPATPGRP